MGDWPSIEQIRAWAERARLAQAAVDELLGPHGGRPADDPPEYDPDDGEAQRIAEVFAPVRADQDRGL